VAVSSRVFAIVLAVCLFLPPAGSDTARRDRPRVKIAEKTYVASSDVSLPGLAVASRYPDLIVVNGQASARIVDVDLTLVDFAHGTPQDLDILLVGPNGRSALVMADAGGTDGVLGIDLTLDDDAKRPLPEDGVLMSGRYRPANYDDGGVVAASEAGGDGTPGTDALPGTPGTPGTPGSPGSPGSPSPGTVDSDAFPAPAPGTGAASLATFRGMAPAGEWRLFIRADGPAAGSLGGWRLTITTKKRR
jgi:hypothetical protein